jgi:hypothetical protein
MTIFKKILIIAFLPILLITGCTEQGPKYLNEADISDLSRYALNLHHNNALTLLPLVESKTAKLENRQVINEILEIALTLDTLAWGYMILSGGAADQGRVLNATMSGSKGYSLYNLMIDKNKLSNKINSIQASSDSSNADLISRFSHMMNVNFIKEGSYFNKEILTSRPYTVLSLETSFIEANIYTMLIEHLDKKVN